MSEECHDSKGNDQNFQRRCVAAIWFEIVDSYIQHRCGQADDKAIKAENKQVAAPKSLRAPFFSYTSSLVVEKR
jgi:hypothetical protein